MIDNYGAPGKKNLLNIVIPGIAGDYTRTNQFLSPPFLGIPRFGLNGFETPCFNFADTGFGKDLLELLDLGISCWDF